MSAISTVTVKVPPMGVKQTFIRDSRRNVWRNDLFRWVGIAELVWNDLRLRAVVTAESATEDRTDAGEKMWAIRLQEAVAEATKRGTFSAFKVNVLTPRAPFSESAAGDSIDVAVTAQFLDRLNSEFERDQQARKRFEDAADRLKDIVEYGVSDEAWKLQMFLQQSLQSGYLGNMHSWYEEKMSGIRSYMQDMSRRKNRNHEGYIRAKNYIQQQLYGFSPPEAWISTPPVMGSG